MIGPLVPVPSTLPSAVLSLAHIYSCALPHLARRGFTRCPFPGPLVDEGLGVQGVDQPQGQANAQRQERDENRGSSLIGRLYEPEAVSYQPDSSLRSSPEVDLRE